MRKRFRQRQADRDTIRNRYTNTLPISVSKVSGRIGEQDASFQTAPSGRPGANSPVTITDTARCVHPSSSGRKGSDSPTTIMNAGLSQFYRLFVCCLHLIKAHDSHSAAPLRVGTNPRRYPEPDRAAAYRTPGHRSICAVRFRNSFLLAVSAFVPLPYHPFSEKSWKKSCEQRILTSFYKKTVSFFRAKLLRTTRQTVR